ncbi:MAG: CDP-alcohol phosphatidyltransferase family protein [Candidatus Promineifilaceae bacterium]
MSGKQVADIITWLRTLIAFALPVLGITQGAKSLQAAVILLIVNWTADSFDGVLARRSRVQYKTWIGDHDLEIDMLIGAGTLIYLFTAGFLSWQAAAIYCLVWLVIFWRFGIPHVLGVLFQAPIYGYFIVRAMMESTQIAFWLILWLLAAIIISWPKFPKVIIPEFLHDVRELVTREKQEQDH